MHRQKAFNGVTKWHDLIHSAICEFSEQLPKLSLCFLKCTSFKRKSCNTVISRDQLLEALGSIKHTF